MNGSNTPVFTNIFYDSSGKRTIGIGDFRSTFDTSEVTSIEWGSRILYGPNNTGIGDDPRVSWGGPYGNTLIRPANIGGGVAIDWENGFIYNSNGSAAVSWETWDLFDTGGGYSVKWNARQMYASSHMTVLDWENGVLIPNGSVQASVDWANSQLLNPGGAVVVDWSSVNGLTLSSGLFGAGDCFQAYPEVKLIDASYSGYQLHMGYFKVVDYASVTRLDAHNGYLNDAAGNTHVDWNGDRLKDAAGTKALSWGNGGPYESRRLYANNGIANADWSSAVTIGDVTLVGNSTKLIVNDSSKTVGVLANTGFYISNAASTNVADFNTQFNTINLGGSTWKSGVTLDDSVSKTKVGDVYAQANSTVIEVADAAKDIKFTTDGFTTHAYDIPVTVKYTLTAANLLTIGSVPIEVVPAPGAGKIVQILGIYSKYNFNTTNFVQGGAMLVTRWTNDALGIGANYDWNGGNQIITTSGQTNPYTIWGRGYPWAQWPTTFINQGISIQTDDVSDPGALATGDGTLDVYVTYKVITV